ncbi:MAG: YggS family pyridoxal phosphate-dependent enzyme, partial [Flavobacteriaceae bacterium]|nr:YggS family pyridoxal phosphate-dependent enzyme [Flavobacteriaceae bacterium]
MSLQEIKNRILQAEIAQGRSVGAVTLVAVSKVQPNERVKAVLD